MLWCLLLWLMVSRYVEYIPEKHSSTYSVHIEAYCIDPDGPFYLCVIAYKFCNELPLPTRSRLTSSFDLRRSPLVSTNSLRTRFGPSVLGKGM
jgi:hypothetical protein